MPPTAADQPERAVAFEALHAAPGAFVVANPWDAGSARLLSRLGFPALATTSGGLAFALGRRDGADLLDRDLTLRNVAEIVAATHLPVSADLESGFGATPGDVAETIRLAAEAGAVGGSIEDSTGRRDDPIQPFEVAVERVAAAVEAARSLPFPFTLTARAENFFLGVPDLDEVIRRLQAFEEAGADVLYAPALPDAGAVRAVCASVDRPVNVLVAGALARLSVADLAACGARRISLGSGLSRAALGGMLRAAREVLDEGTFLFAPDAPPYGELNGLMSDEPLPAAGGGERP